MLIKEMQLRQAEIEGNLRKEAKTKAEGGVGLVDEALERQIRELEEQIEKAENMEEVQELEKRIKALEDQKAK